MSRLNLKLLWIFFKIKVGYVFQLYFVKWWQRRRTCQLVYGGRSLPHLFCLRELSKQVMCIVLFVLLQLQRQFIIFISLSYICIISIHLLYLKLGIFICHCRKWNRSNVPVVASQRRFKEFTHQSKNIKKELCKDVGREIYQDFEDIQVGAWCRKGSRGTEIKSWSSISSWGFEHRCGH